MGNEHQETKKNAYGIRGNERWSLNERSINPGRARVSTGLDLPWKPGMDHLEKTRFLRGDENLRRPHTVDQSALKSSRWILAALVKRHKGHHFSPVLPM